MPFRLSLLLALIPQFSLSSVLAAEKKLPERVYALGEVLPVSFNVSLNDHHTLALGLAVYGGSTPWFTLLGEWNSIHFRNKSNTLGFLRVAAMGLGVPYRGGFAVRANSGLGIAFGQMGPNDGFAGTLFGMIQVGGLLWGSEVFAGGFFSPSMGGSLGTNLRYQYRWFGFSLRLVYYRELFNWTSTPYCTSNGHSGRFFDCGRNVGLSYDISSTPHIIEFGPSITLFGVDLYAALKQLFFDDDDALSVIFSLSWTWTTKSEQLVSLH